MESKREAGRRGMATVRCLQEGATMGGAGSSLSYPCSGGAVAVANNVENNARKRVWFYTAIVARMKNTDALTFEEDGAQPFACAIDSSPDDRNQ